MKQSILAPLCSAFVLPGLGQIINHQLAKGLVIITVTTAILIALLIKVGMDFSAVLTGIMGPDFQLTSEQWLLVLDGMRARVTTTFYALVIGGIGIWLFSILDAYWFGRTHEAPAGEKEHS